MPGSNQIISEMLFDINAMENFDFLKPLIHSPTEELTSKSFIFILFQKRIYRNSSLTQRRENSSEICIVENMAPI